MDNLYTIKQISFILKVHQLTVRRYIKEKKLEAVKIGGAVRVSDQQLEQFQKKYSVGEKKPSDKLSFPTKKIFSFDDPLWHLDGFGTSISLPEIDT
jgi:excisionase family DNA binding protein